jgi:GNAT superfamily N-acetyltransferase
MHIDTNTKLTLSPRRRPALLRHFMALDAEDRRLRFGHPISDEVIAQYLDVLDAERDGLFVARDARRRIVGVAHVALRDDRAEAGLSVLAKARGLGLGTRLFQAAAEFARARGATRIDMHFLSENRGIQHIARKCGMKIIGYAGESEAFLLIPPPDLPVVETPGKAVLDSDALAA